MKCRICRVFRQSLLLEEVTFEGVMKHIRKTTGEVTVHWQDISDTHGKPSAFLKVMIEGRHGCAGVVNLGNRNEVSHLAPHPDVLNATVIEQATNWLKACLDDHIGECDNLSFSNESPRFLIEILSPESIQLCDGKKIRICQGRPAKYVALSYCWGSNFSKAELEVVNEGKTLTTNWRFRLKPFPTKDLPATVRDSLRIIHAMGIRYAWIDALCRRQDTSEDLATMHHVYSNALFTLCACATDKATAGLLEQREAWSLRTEPCRLGGQWLTTANMSLNELRLRSPLAGRAWTLQEERLSPRMLYVSSSRMYWSCAKGHKMELKPVSKPRSLEVQRPVYSVLDHMADLSLSQEFLVACYNRKGDLCPFWADIVKSYALRSMTNLSDRLTALSGLAAKYLSANTTDRYLAGIWTNSLAEGLAWKVKMSVGDERIKVDPDAPKWPSWSWAALPLQTAIETDVKSARSAFFRIIPDDDDGRLMAQGREEEAVEKGTHTKKICVTGRVRKLWEPSSGYVDWSEVSHTVHGYEKFTFAANPQQNVHAVDLKSGRILVYENRKREVVGQIDFQHDVIRLRSGQMDLVALEMGETIMLLLEKSAGGTHRRVGVAWDVRKDFFVLVEDYEVFVLE